MTGLPKRFPNGTIEGVIRTGLGWSRRVFLAAGLALVLTGWGSVALSAQSVANNPYRAVYDWPNLPEGRELGVVSGIKPDADGEHLWILERCGGNQCANSDLNPVHKFDLDGNIVKSIGAGLFAWPHGFDVDDAGNIWVADGAPLGDRRGEPGFSMGKGQQVFKLSPEGEVLMTLGEAGVAGDDKTHFNGPAAVLVAPNGEIWVADGHRSGNNRVMKFSPDGEFIWQLGGAGAIGGCTHVAPDGIAPSCPPPRPIPDPITGGGGVKSASGDRGRFYDLHDLAMDRLGRLFVADRGNNRIQVFRQDGELLAIWTQFGKPSGMAIDSDDRIYVVDGMSGGEWAGRAWNPGWERGIRIGDAETGWISAFIPDYEIAAASSMEFIGVDSRGDIYGGDVGRRRLVKYVRVRP